MTRVSGREALQIILTLGFDISKEWHGLGRRGMHNSDSHGGGLVSAEKFLMLIGAYVTDRHFSSPTA
jgi:hypothetical protein